MRIILGVFLCLGVCCAGNSWAASFADAAPLGTARYLHTATLLSSGRVLVTGGTSDGTTFLSSAEVYDPASNTWSAAGTLSAARGYHTATLLPNGKVLITGGYDNIADLSNVDIYDPATNSCSAGPSLAAARGGHTATLLPTGKVLVAGGHDPSVLNSAELYDPAINMWGTAASFSTARVFHTATLLSNGKVLISGGFDGTGSSGTAEVYNPANNTWGPAGGLGTARESHTAMLLPSGNVLAIGGDNGGPTTSVEVFSSNVWTNAASLPLGIRNFTATLLPDGTVFTNGGYDGSFATSTASLYNPVGNSWSPSGNMTSVRRYHTSTLLPSGLVLIVGGDDGSGTAINGVEIFDPKAGGAWTAGGNLGAARAAHTATLLASGKVLVAGGFNPSYLNSAEVYDPALNTWSAAGSLSAARDSHTATLLPSGKVLVAGGYDGSSSISGAEVYDPALNTWSVAGSLGAARHSHTATLLPNGKVLVAGGYNGGILSSAEVYDPALNTWSAAGSLGTPRENHTATLLPSGKVLVAGGDSLTSAELYDPALNTWSAAGSLNSARGFHTATLLPNGNVLVAGGFYSGSYLSSAEVYNPVNNMWTLAASLSGPRDRHTAMLLPSGKVLVAGGYYSSSSVNSAEVYDPVPNTWIAVGSLNTAREYFTATLLANGKVLAAAGINAGAVNSSELFDTGLGFMPAWQPNISSTNSPLSIGIDQLVLGGGGFTGISEASGGSSNNSATNYPIVQLRSLGNDQTVFLPSPSWSNIAFISANIPPFPEGWAMVTVFTNGIPSKSTFTRIKATNAPPVINSFVSQSNPGLNNTPISFLLVATDPDTSNLMYDINFGDGSPTSFGMMLSGATTTVVHTFTAGGSYSVTASASDGQTTVSTNLMQVTTAPPVILSFASQQTPALLGTVVTYLLTAVDTDSASLMYGIDFGDGSAPSNGTMAPGATVTVMHTFSVAGSFTVTASVSDGQSTVSASTPQDIPAPDSGGEGITNVSDGQAPVVNPLNGITVQVAKSNGGVVQLAIAIDVNALSANMFEAKTEFGDIPGRETTVMGMTPVHQFVQHGIFVAKSSAINITTGTTAGIARKTVTVGSKETGEAANAVGADRLGDPPSNGILVKSIKSKFSFKGANGSSERATSTDTVTFSGSILLPSGLNPAKPHEFSVGIGNIIVNAMLDAHGKGTSTGGSNLLKSMKVTFKGVKKGTVTKGGETAQFTLTFSTTGIVAAGFDTEGISNKSTDVTPGRSAMRKIQLALLLDGTPYEFQAGVTFAISNDSAFGTISGRSAKP